MKPGFARLRPSHTASLEGHLHLHTFDNGSVYRGGPFGFVSSHAANTFGIATLAVLLFGAGRWRWLWLWAAAMSWTRIYLGVHYPGDILFGALFGAGWACAIFTALRRFSPATHTPQNPGVCSLVERYGTTVPYLSQIRLSEMTKLYKARLRL